MTKKTKIILGSLFTVVVLVVAGTLLFMANTKPNNSSSPKDQATTSKTLSSKASSSSLNKNSSSNKKTSKTAKKGKKSQKSKNTNEPMTRNGAVAASQALLRGVNKDPKGRSDAQRLKLLNKSDNAYTQVLSQSVRNQIRLVDFMKSDKRGGTLTAQALIEVVHGLKKNGNKNLTVTKMNNYSSIVYFDKSTKTAIIPVDLYTREETNLNLDFVYLNGKWMLEPYNLISEISIRQTDEENAVSQSTSSTKKSSNKSKSTKNNTSAKKTDKSSQTK